MRDTRFRPFTASSGMYVVGAECYDCGAAFEDGQSVAAVPGTATGCGTRPSWAYRHVTCPASSIFGGGVR